MAKKLKISFIPTRHVVPHGETGPYSLYLGYTDWVLLHESLTNAGESVMSIYAVLDDKDPDDEIEIGMVIVDHTELIGADVWYYWPTRTVIDAAFDTGNDQAGSALALAYTAARAAWVASRIELLRQRFPNGEFIDTIRLSEELTLKKLLKRYDLS